MAISFQVLGEPGCDNALYVQVESGQAIERLLFDCGEGCVNALPFSDVQAVDHLFFSHFHMDHVSGFDSFFRCNFKRETKVNRVWGPPLTIPIMRHRFRGFIWNLHEQMSGTWSVSEIHPGEIHSARFELREAFETTHSEPPRAWDRVVAGGEGFTVEAITLDHRIPSIGYVVREKPRWNFDPARLAGSRLRPGPWMKVVREESSEKVEVEGASYVVAELRQQLLLETPGDSIAYLTDFTLGPGELERLSGLLRNCGTLVCEGQYRHADIDLARRNYHLTTTLAATLAKESCVGQLMLFHLSDRYQPAEWLEMLQEARTVFPNTTFSDHWHLNPG